MRTSGAGQGGRTREGVDVEAAAAAAKAAQWGREGEDVEAMAA